MKNIIKYIIPAAVAMLSFAACEDHRADNLEEFNTVLYFRNGGLQDLTLYRTGEDGIYSIPVCKAGYDIHSVTSATVKVFNDALLEEYNAANDTELQLIPEEYYKFVSATHEALPDQESVLLDFGSEDLYKTVLLSVNTAALNDFLNANPDTPYVFAFKLYSEDPVTERYSYIILTPEVIVPVLSFKTAGIENFSLNSESPEIETYSNTVVLNMEDNKWDFTCDLEVMDEEWLAGYNAEKGTSYIMLPEDAYTFQVKELNFSSGVSEVSFNVDVKRSEMELLTEYVVPIRLSSCSKDQFEINHDKEVYLLNVRMDPDKIKLTESMITACNTQSGDGQGVPGLIDGNTNTYWHSVWNTVLTNADPVYGVYLDIALESPLSTLVCTYCTRAQNANGAPRHIVVGVSNDGSSWKTVGDFATEAMRASGKGTWITLPVMKTEENFTYIRFGIAESAAGDLRVNGVKCYTALSELEISGVK